jgi:hypothetical protein
MGGEIAMAEFSEIGWMDLTVPDAGGVGLGGKILVPEKSQPA